MNTKDNRRSKMTKKLLQNSLLELLEIKNLSNISICSICERADVNRSTFYKYYSSPYDLMEEIENELAAYT